VLVGVRELAIRNASANVRFELVLSCAASLACIGLSPYNQH
jgi:hypothetical protein